MKKKALKKKYNMLKEQYASLRDSYEEACGYLRSYSQELQEKNILLRYQHDYIHWKSLDDEFALFQ